MKLASLHIRDFRGIKDLHLDLQERNFVVDGPNGSGKSGVVDAVEYVFTGRIARLEGPGTGGLSVRTHGPHVDKRDNPRDAFVKATICLDDGSTVTIERGLDKPKEPKVTPASAEVDIRWIAGHPEIALSRRELVKFILVEPGQRSKEVQSLLKLERLDEARRNLTTASNTLARDRQSAEQDTAWARTHFLTAAGIGAMRVDDVLAAANERRQILGLPRLSELAATTRLASGFGEGSAGNTTPPTVNKELATRDADALEEFLSASGAGNKHVVALLGDLAQLDGREDLVALLDQHDLIQSGLSLATVAACPLCDAEWDLNTLRAHLKEKLDRAEDAKSYADNLIGKAQFLAGDAQTLADHLETMAKHALALGIDESARVARAWRDQLASFRDRLRTAKGIIALRDRLALDWTSRPGGATDALVRLRDAIGALKAPSETDNARTYLLVCDDRLDVYRAKRVKESRLKTEADVAERTKTLFDATVEEHLSRLYSAVEQDLVRFYRFINENDEENFDAKLDPKKGKLTLEVDFYDRGLFPPGAYHSEGHQDGMGLCLYLALMKRLLGDRFTFGVLDDVLMSVDKGHRKQVCGLLKKEFAKTQFVITTHDDVWLHQMIAAKFVDKVAVKRFRGWTVEHGPLVDGYKEVWESIDEHLSKEEIPQAAGLLRRHLEQVAGDLCERFRASAPYRRDADHDLGDLLPAATGKWTKLLKEAKAAAVSWAKQQDVDTIAAREETFKTRLGATNMEQWALNKSVHYNEWANMTKNDFQPVVEAYRGLFSLFTCEACDGWLSVSPTKGNPEAILCDCKAVCLNLRKKTSAKDG